MAMCMLVGCEDPKAPGKCRDLRDALCRNAVDYCGDDIEFEACQQVANDAGFNCEDAWGVSDSYESCLMLISGSDECLLDSRLPSVCDDAILTHE